MATRKIKTVGQGFGASPAAITVTVDGSVVFSGTVPTVNEPPTGLPGVPVASLPTLYEYEVPNSFSGNQIVSVQVTAGAVTFATLASNNMGIHNPVFTAEEYATLTDPASLPADRLAIRVARANPPMSQTDIDNLNSPSVSQSEKYAINEAHNVNNIVSAGDNAWSPITGLYSAVTIDGVSQSTAFPDGDYVLVNNGSTLGFTQIVPEAYVPIY